MDSGVAGWLLGDDNPAVGYRTMTELLGIPLDGAQVPRARQAMLRWLPQARDPAWQTDVCGLWLTYHLTALAECGLTRDDVDVSAAVDRYLAGVFDGGCGDAMALRALVMLGYDPDARVLERLAALAAEQLPDGGFLCLHRVRKLTRTPKSCYKANTLALMLHAECAKCGVPFVGREELAGYFLRRRIYYRSDDPMRLVLDARPGWRAIDTVYPFEVMRVGIQNIAEALATLGYGALPALDETWALLDAQQDPQGRTLLRSTLSKPYLPIEPAGKPIERGTLYGVLAQANRQATFSSREVSTWYPGLLASRSRAFRGTFRG